MADTITRNKSPDYSYSPQIICYVTQRWSDSFHRVVFNCVPPINPFLNVLAPRSSDYKVGRG